MGRPSLYKDEYPGWALKLTRLGATNEDLARAFDVHVDTIKEWRNVYPKFSAALKEGKDFSDANVADRLYSRAMGYEKPAVKHMVVCGEVVTVEYTEHCPPDTTACIFWLKNRQSAKWRDKQSTRDDNNAADALRELIVKLPD